MADAPRITVEELKRRLDTGEDFTVIDVRNPTAWAETDTAIPEAIRVPLEQARRKLAQNSEEQTCRRVLHLTQRRVKRQFGAETSATRLQERVGASGRIPSMAKCRIAS